MPTPQPSDTLRALLRAIGLTEQQLRGALAEASRASRDIVLQLQDGEPTFSRRVRIAQMQLAQEQIALWARNEQLIRQGALRSGTAAADMSVLWSGDLLRDAGVKVSDWKRSMRATAQQGVRTYLARQHHSFSLSARVFRNRALAAGTVERTVNTGLLLGKSAKEIADDVYRYINPRTPGGASYAALRLGRTELNNAFHEIARQDADDTPWTTSVQWHLSGSHPRPDICDDYANDTHRRGGQPGEFKADSIPDKPHPQCFCFTTPVNVSDEQFIRNFNAGRYDSYINRVEGTTLAA